MHRANRIGVCWLLIGLFAWGDFLTAGTTYPVIPGYDRFHSQRPSAEGGRILFNELGCVNCHRNPTGLPSKRGPRLAGLSSRVHLSWIRDFLKDPATRKPGATMPSFDLDDDEIAMITHYLASLESSGKVRKAFKFVNARRGHELYHRIGCVACHLPSSDPNASENRLPRSPYPELKKKYDIHSLSAFLFQPHATRPSGRMPRFLLEREDGGDLAAYLLDYANGDASEYPPLANAEPDARLAERGRDLVVAHNCAACHAFPNSERLPSRRRTKLTPEAVIPEGHPGYVLSEYHRESIRLFLRARHSPASATLIMETLNCLACHERDGKGGPADERLAYFTGDPDLGDAGRLPPPLTEAGFKLKKRWLQSAIQGKVSVRPYLHTRMPNFGDKLTRSLAKRLRAEDRPRRRHKLPKGNIDAGQTLLGADGGLNCIACHRWGERESLGIRGLDLSNLSDRLEKAWFYEFLIDPGGNRANTLMPSFWPKGKASNKRILQGDTEAQIASIYAFAERGAGVPEGYPDVGIFAFELVPTDGAIVQRTFLEGVGTDALLVGFPERIHYAVDGSTGRPALMWKGRFFDAYRTWFSRFPQFEKPLGSEIVTWPDVRTEADSSYKGYRMEDPGSPVFISELMGSVMYERLQPHSLPDGAMAMKRTIRYTRERQLHDPLLSHPVGVEVTELSATPPLTRVFLYQW